MSESLDEAALMDLRDCDFTHDDSDYRLIFQRDGVWAITQVASGDELGILHRKPAGTWEIMDQDGNRHRQGPDWRTLIANEIAAEN